MGIIVDRRSETGELRILEKLRGCERKMHTVVDRWRNIFLTHWWLISEDVQLQHVDTAFFAQSVQVCEQLERDTTGEE